MDVTSANQLSVSAPSMLFPTTAGTINNSISQFTSNLVGQNAEVVSVNVCGATQIIDNAPDILFYCD